jgi:hypothetical protein
VDSSFVLRSVHIVPFKFAKIEYVAFSVLRSQKQVAYEREENRKAERKQKDDQG